MNDQLLLTADGADRLKKELDDLIKNARPEIAKRLRFAVQQGDLSENADYHKAKEDQSFLEGRIQELEYLLKNATIVQGNTNKSEVVDIGVTVTVEEAGYPPETFQIVGVKEADPRQQRISHESPIGKALLNHREGDLVIAQTPDGEIKLSIVKIH